MRTSDEWKRSKYFPVLKCDRIERIKNIFQGDKILYKEFIDALKLVIKQKIQDGEIKLDNHYDGDINEIGYILSDLYTFGFGWPSPLAFLAIVAYPYNFTFDFIQEVFYECVSAKKPEWFEV